jgi:carbon-monoxide dehydrogenase medium subunit
MATVGGSLAGIYLPSDLAVALIAQDAELDILGDGGRTVNVGDLLENGWLKAPDLICTIRVQKPAAPQGTGYSKLGRSQIDVALVNAAALVVLSEAREVQDLRVSVGQSFSMPVLVKDVGEKARGKTLSLHLIKDLARLASDSVEPKSDFRASSWYRKHAVEALVARAIFDAAEEAGGRIEN